MNDEITESNELKSIVVECSNCFLIEEIISSGGSRKAILYRCNHCKEHPECCVDVEAKMERMLAVMHRTNANNLPNVLRLMYKVFMGQKWNTKP